MQSGQRDCSGTGSTAWSCLSASDCDEDSGSAGQWWWEMRTSGGNWTSHLDSDSRWSSSSLEVFLLLLCQRVYNWARWSSSHLPTADRWLSCRMDCLRKGAVQTLPSWTSSLRIFFWRTHWTRGCSECHSCPPWLASEYEKFGWKLHWITRKEFSERWKGADEASSRWIWLAAVDFNKQNWWTWSVDEANESNKVD